MGSVSALSEKRGVEEEEVAAADLFPGHSKRQPQECLFCGKVLQNYFSLEMHMNSHTRERPWECSHCDATFMSYNVLMVHRNNIHYGRKYKCNLCHRLFNISAHLYTHRKRAHPHAEKGAMRTKVLCGRSPTHPRAKKKKAHEEIQENSRKEEEDEGVAVVAQQESPPPPPSEATTESVSPAETLDNVIVNSTSCATTCLAEEFDEEEEEERRKVVEIESNPGTPLMTVNVLSKDAEVVSKLKLPVIKIQRLPDGVWKQKIVNSSQNETENGALVLIGKGNDYLGEAEDDQETEPEDYTDEFSSEDQVYAELKVYPPLPFYQYQTPIEPPPSSPSPLLPHQIPPLPPFNLVFPPFPFKLHNYTVPPENTAGDYYLGAAGEALLSSSSSSSPQQLQNVHPQNIWDTSFFLHLNRYKPDDDCNSQNQKSNGQNDNSNSSHSEPANAKPQPNRKSSQTEPKKRSLKSSSARSSYQFAVSKLCLKKKKKLAMSRNKNGMSSKFSKKEQSCGKSKKKKCRPNGNHGTSIKANTTSRVEKEELIQESETGVFTCKECKKEFQIKWNLLTHLMTHTGEKPFGCYFCKMRFRQKAHMIKHIASIHRFQDDDNKRPLAASPAGGKGKGKVSCADKDDFSCGFCGDAYKVKLGLIKHISQLHSDKLVESM